MGYWAAVADVNRVMLTVDNDPGLTVLWIDRKQLAVAQFHYHVHGNDLGLQRSTQYIFTPVEMV